MTTRSFWSVIVPILLLWSSTSLAAAKKYAVSGKVTDGSGYSVMLVQKNGTTKTARLGNSGSFSFKNLTLSQIKGASIQLVDADGQYAGPVVLGSKGSRVSTTFSGKAGSSATFQLGRITPRSGYGTLKQNALKATAYTRPNISADSGRPIGAGELGLVQATTSRITDVRSRTTDNPGEDTDRDGIPSAFDADDDGDLILDTSDPDSSGLDIPYTSLNFDFRKTLNSHVRTGLSDSVIDAAIGGENVFALTFFFSLAPNQTSIDGGYVICDDSLVYCRRNTPVGYYGGISESSSEFRDHPWSELLTSAGYPRMERISVGGNPAIVASIQPRVGRAQFRPGDVYQIQLTSGSSVVASRSLALAPYFVSIPAIKEYNAGFGTVSVDYNSVDANGGSIPGLTGNPIVLSGDGLLTLTFWRPQRAALRTDESGFYDWGNLNYGIIIEQAQATCAGYYSALSTDLTEDSSPLGEGNSPLAQNGANLTPLRDNQGDRAADSANSLTLTVNLKDCLARAGLSAGDYSVSLRGAGEEVTGGQVSATQSIVVQIP